MSQAGSLGGARADGLGSSCRRCCGYLRLFYSVSLHLYGIEMFKCVQDMLIFSSPHVFHHSV